MDRANQHLYDEPEGGDITGADMIEQESDLLNFYKGSTVLVTGATGYLGKLQMEKLLRSCNVKKIYVIIRTKKGKHPQTRFEELFNEPCCEPLKRKDPDCARKLHMLVGDVALPNLGLLDEDIHLLKAEVEVVFHYAATIRSDEKLKTAAFVNVRGTRDLLRIARDMKKLKAFMYVSTAFSNCVHQTIKENLYKPPISAEKLMILIECLDDNRLEAITQSLLGEYPNMHIFTKCIAEHLLKTEGHNLPLGLYRPSIVIGTLKEPISGWVNKMHVTVGVVFGASMGLLRSLHGNPNNKADMVPADYVINGCIAAAWDVANIKGINENKQTIDLNSNEENFEEIPIYNCVSTPERPITWSQFHDLNAKHLKQIPSEKMVWPYVFKMIENRNIYLLSTFFLHTVPAHIVDFLARCLGKEQMMVKTYKKMNRYVDVLAYFCKREWHFENNNVQSLWKKLNRKDKTLFEFSMNLLDWDLYNYTSARGSRLYILNEPLDTVSKGKAKYFKLFVAHYTLVVILLLLFMTAIAALFKFIF